MVAANIRTSGAIDAEAERATGRRQDARPVSDLCRGLLVSTEGRAPQPNYT